MSRKGIRSKEAASCASTLRCPSLRTTLIVKRKLRLAGKAAFEAGIFWGPND